MGRVGHVGHRARIPAAPAGRGRPRAGGGQRAVRAGRHPEVADRGHELVLHPLQRGRIEHPVGQEPEDLLAHAVRQRGGGGQGGLSGARGGGQRERSCSGPVARCETERRASVPTAERASARGEVDVVVFVLGQHLRLDRFVLHPGRLDRQDAAVRQFHRPVAPEGGNRHAGGAARERHGRARHGADEDDQQAGEGEEATNHVDFDQLRARYLPPVESAGRYLLTLRNRTSPDHGTDGRRAIARTKGERQGARTITSEARTQ